MSAQNKIIKKPETLILLRDSGFLWTLVNHGMVEAAGIEPASENFPPLVLRVYPHLFSLTVGYPMGRKNQAAILFSVSYINKGILYSDLM